MGGGESVVIGIAHPSRFDPSAPLRISPDRSSVVHRPDRYAYRGAAARMGGDPAETEHADRRSHRLGQDAGCLPDRARRVAPTGDRWAARGRGPRPLRIAAQGAERRHPQEPGRAPSSDPAARRNRRTGGASDHGRGPDRRHHRVRAGRDAADAAAYSRHHARIALSPPDLRAQPADAAHGPDGHRRRDSRGHRHPARRAPRPVARAARPPRRPSGAADRALGHAEADHFCRALPRRRPRRGLRDRGRRAPPPDGPGPRGPALCSRRGDGPGSLGGGTTTASGR